MQTNFQSADIERFAAALRRIDEANADDPNIEVVDGTPQPRELVYARRLTDWVLALCPEASEVLRLAARCQHICRWTIPRDSYPSTRAGYLRWREALKSFHAQKSGEVLRDAVYPDDLIRRVQELNLKKNFPHDPESRVLEDALCLMFLQHQLAELADKSSSDSVVNALRKSWAKMTPAAQTHARQLALGPREKQLLQVALATPT